MLDDADIYQALIMERARTPRHAGRPARFEAEGEGDNPMCGDRIHVFVGRDGMKVNHESRGCAIMIASAELMADAVAGLKPDEIITRRAAFEAMVQSGTPNPDLGNLNALAGVSQYRSRIRCATLPWSALGSALQETEHG